MKGKSGVHIHKKLKAIYLFPSQFVQTNGGSYERERVSRKNNMKRKIEIVV